MSVADYVFAELNPDASDFAERFRGARPALAVALHHLGFEDYSMRPAESQLWKRVSCGLACIRDGSTGHVEAARDCLRAIRRLRDYERLDHAMTVAACELSRLRRRLLESSASSDQLRALVSRWRSAASRVDGGSSDEKWARSIALEECAAELQRALDARPEDPVPGPSDQTQPVPVIGAERPHPMVKEWL